MSFQTLQFCALIKKMMILHKETIIVTATLKYYIKKLWILIFKPKKVFKEIQREAKYQNLVNKGDFLITRSS